MILVECPKAHRFIVGACVGRHKKKQYRCPECDVRYERFELIVIRGSGSTKKFGWKNSVAYLRASKATSHSSSHLHVAGLSKRTTNTKVCESFENKVKTA